MKRLICLSCSRMADGPIEHLPDCPDTGMEVETFVAIYPKGVVDLHGDVMLEDLKMVFTGKVTDYEIATDGTKVIRAAELLSVSLVEKPLHPDWVMTRKEPG